MTEPTTTSHPAQRVLVTGGAGFLGINLCRYLLARVGMAFSRWGSQGMVARAVAVSPNAGTSAHIAHHSPTFLRQCVAMAGG